MPEQPALKDRAVLGRLECNGLESEPTGREIRPQAEAREYVEYTG